MDRKTGRAQLILALRQQGIRDARVLDVMETTPREACVGDEFKNKAWENQALPIQYGQTISQPFVVGAMSAALELKGHEKVLEIGTGSGYQSAILSKLCRRVFTIERYRPLLRIAQSRFEQLRLNNIVSKCADGSLGWPEQGPYDAIISTCACPARPDKLLSQLKTGGVLVAPVGMGSVQELLRYRLREDGIFEEEALMDVRFVPLLPGTSG